MTEQVRILYVINSMEGGGAASPVPSILTVLRDAGAQVRLVALTRRNGLAIPPIEEAGFPVHLRPDGGEKDNVAAFRYISQQAREFGATHIWTSLTRATLLGQLAGKRLGIPVVSWQHNAFLKPWNERLLKLTSGWPILWVADSDEVAALTAQRLDVRPERLVTWPIFFADPSAPLAQAWQQDEPLKLGSLGRLHPNKGYDILVEALALLKSQGFAPPARFTIAIAGQGAREAELRAAMQNHGISNIELAGFTSDPRAFLADLHLYLQPSRREGFCIAAHEAMQAGLPVIGSATGQMPHTIEAGKTGWIANPADPVSLAAALREALSHPARLAEMGALARKSVLKQYSKDRFSEIGRTIVERIRR